MKPINISSLIKKYGPGYVAKSKKSGKVVASAKRLDVLFRKVGMKSDITIAWVPKGNVKYVFSAVISEKDSLPLLLGRKDIFEKNFNLTLDSARHKTIITSNS